jgi:hypothetical protein
MNNTVNDMAAPRTSSSVESQLTVESKFNRLDWMPSIQGNMVATHLEHRLKKGGDGHPEIADRTAG